MEKKFNGLSMFKNFPSNLLFFTSILGLVIALFAFLRISVYEKYIRITDSSGWGGLALLGPYGAIVYCAIIFVIFLVLAILFKNFELKMQTKNIKLFFKLTLIFLIFIIAYFFIFMSVYPLWYFESDILNYCYSFSFCYEKGAQDDEIRKQKDGSTIIMHSTCPQDFNSICWFNFSK